MELCHGHNRRAGLVSAPKRFGLRLSLPPGDPMRKVLGDDWHQYQWFGTERAREAKAAELTGQFLYYRRGDRPTFLIERVEQEDQAE